MGVRTVNERVTNSLLKSFDASIVTYCDFTNWEGNPDMTPVEGLRDKPVGRDPDMTENDKPSPLIEGVAENGLSFVRTYSDSG